jgi:antitoxin CptB
MNGLGGLNGVAAWLMLPGPGRQARQARLLKDDMMTETADIRLRRLKMRSWRRGMKEMDLILGHFADGPLSNLSPQELDAYESVLTENDQDLYLWVTARVNGGDNRGPAEIAAILDRIADHAAERLKPVR